MSKMILIMAAIVTLLAAVIANGQDFAVSIVGFRQSGYWYSRKGLPLVYYAGPAPRAGSAFDVPSENSFFVVVQNLQKVPDKMSRSGSSWYDCLQFTIKTSSGKTYTVSRLEFAWSANPMETWVFPSGGMRVFPVDFSNPCWKGQPPVPSEPEVVTMTVTFRYPDSKGNLLSVQSSPTDVYWCSSSSP